MTPLTLPRRHWVVSQIHNSNQPSSISPLAFLTQVIHETGEPADNGGANVDEYILESCLNKGDQMEQLYRGHDTEFTVTNPCPGSTYRLRVFCVSQGGTSMPSEVGFVSVPPVAPGQCMPPWTPSKPGSSIVHLQWGEYLYSRCDGCLVRCAESGFRIDFWIGFVILLRRTQWLEHDFE